MKKCLLQLTIVAFSLAPLQAQDFKMPNLEKLAERAKETVDVTLDQSLLQLASGFLSRSDPDEANVKKLVAKLKGVYVRSFEFEKEGQYSLGDFEAMRAQLKGPNWSRIVNVKSNTGENTEIYLLRKGEGIGGLVLLSAEPKELTIVHIDGPIKPEELSQLSGHMGIPELGKPGKAAKPGKEED